MRYLSVLALSIVVVCWFSLSQQVSAKTLFEDSFDRGDGEWDLVDNGGVIEVKKSDPPEYGPNVLVMESPGGINVLAFIKDGFDEFRDGIIELLWRDKEIGEGGVADRDADGPLIFRVQGHVWGSLYLIELDVDTGFHFDVVGGAGAGPGGIKSTGNWNWIKARIEGDLMQAKTWEPGQEEPKDWMLELEDATYEMGSIGLRSWSGTIEVAYFRVSDLDGPSISVEPQYKATSTWGDLKADH